MKKFTLGAHMVSVKRIFCGVTFVMVLSTILIIVLLSSCETYRTSLEAEYFRQGAAAFKSKDYSAALSFFKKAQHVSFGHSANYRIAEIYILQNQYPDARKLIDMLMRIDANNTLVQELDVLWYAKQFSVPEYKNKAEERYAKLFSHDITMNGRVYANAGIFYLNVQEYSKSRELLQKAFSMGILLKETVSAYVQSFIEEYRETAAASLSGNSAEEKAVNIQELHHAASLLVLLYRDGKISPNELFEIAQKFEDVSLFTNAFAIYTELADIKEQTTFENGGNESSGTEANTIDINLNTKKIRLQSCAALANMILSKQYAPANGNIPSTVLLYVEKILIEMYSPLSGLEKEIFPDLQDIFENPDLTEVLKKRIQELYEQYGVRLPENNSSDNTEPAVMSKQDGDSSRSKE